MPLLRTSRLCVLFAALSLFLWTGVTRGETPDRFPPKVVLSDTLLAAHLDLDEIDASALEQILSQVAAGQKLSSTAGPLWKVLRDAGADHVFVSVHGRALLQGAACVRIECEDTAEVSSFLDAMFQPGNFPFEFAVLRVEGAVIVCPASLRDIYSEDAQAVPDPQRPEFDRGLAAMSQFAHQAVISLPDDIRQEVIAMWPENLGENDQTGISPRSWMASARSVQIGWDLPPQAAFEIRVQAADADAAAVNKAQWENLLKLVPAQMPRPEITVDDATVVVKADREKLQNLIESMLRPARQNARRMQTVNNLKQLALGMHNFHETYKSFPGRHTVDEQGRPLLSWRVALLPFVDQIELYRSFKLDEPWDSEHNRRLIEKMPSVFKVMSDEAPNDELPAGHSRIRLPALAGSMWHGDGPPRTIRDVTDGTSNTIMIGTAPQSAAVPWTKPDAWQLDGEQLNAQFFGDQEQAIVGFADGSVRLLSPTIEAAVLKALLTMAGREVIPQDAF